MKNDGMKGGPSDNSSDGTGENSDSKGAPDGKGGPGGNSDSNGGPGGNSSGVESYDSVNEYTKDTTVKNKTIKSTGEDENAILVSDGASVKVTDSTVKRTSSSSSGGDNSSFYGVGAALLVADGKLEVSDTEITTDAAGGAGVFAYGDGTAVVKNTKISTTKGTSGGIHVAGGGTLKASNLTVNTKGESSAAIRSDRGGGTMKVNGGSYTSEGTGSPAIYSTADISVKNAKLTATNSEAICIEGQNSIALKNCDLSGDMPENSQNDCTWNVIVYQSMSGDSEEGNGTFKMTGGSLTAKNGGMFYTTNTESTFYIEDVDISYSKSNDFFLKCTGNSNKRGWGSSGSNGADCKFTAKDQDMKGDVIYDSISNLDFYMTGKSTLKGAFIDDESNAGDGGDGECSLHISEKSTWIVTEDSTVTNLYNEGTIKDSKGKTVTIKDSDGNVIVKGKSSVTVTVENYED